MRETSSELDWLQRLLTRSHDSATGHLQGIIREERRLSARELAALLTGMKVLTVATVTATGEPRISAMDGHFLHGTWTFGTAASSAKARHLAARPAVSVAHVDGEDLAVFSHGQVKVIDEDHQDRVELIEHWTAYYGVSPVTFIEDGVFYRLQPSWMVGFATNKPELLAERLGHG